MTDSKNGGSRLDASQLYAILDDLAGISELQRQPINEVELDHCDPVPLPTALIDRTLESIRSMQATEVALDASQLYPILDDLAGITELQRQPINEVELDDCDPVPLPTALIDRTLESIRSMQAPEVPATPRRWWSRPAAALPIAVSVLLLAAAPIYFFWSGRNSTKTLAYEDALDIVFDGNYPEESRNSALKRVSSSILMGISALKQAAGGSKGLQAETKVALSLIDKMIDDPGLALRGTQLANGRFQEILDLLRGRPVRVTACLAAMPSFLNSCSSGIWVLQSARAAGGPLLSPQASTHLRNIRRRIRRRQ